MRLGRRRGSAESSKGGGGEKGEPRGVAYGSMPAVSATLLMAEMTSLASSGLSLLLSSMVG